MQSPVYAGLAKKDRYSEEEEKQIRMQHNEASARMIIDSLSHGSQLNLGLEECAHMSSVKSRIIIEIFPFIDSFIIF